MQGQDRMLLLSCAFVLDKLGTSIRNENPKRAHVSSRVIENDMKCVLRDTDEPTLVMLLAVYYLFSLLHVLRLQGQSLCQFIDTISPLDEKTYSGFRCIYIMSFRLATKYVTDGYYTNSKNWAKLANVPIPFFHYIERKFLKEIDYKMDPGGTVIAELTTKLVNVVHVQREQHAKQTYDYSDASKNSSSEYWNLSELGGFPISRELGVRCKEA